MSKSRAALLVGIVGLIIVLLSGVGVVSAPIGRVGAGLFGWGIFYSLLCGVTDSKPSRLAVLEDRSRRMEADALLTPQSVWADNEEWIRRTEAILNPPEPPKPIEECPGCGHQMADRYYRSSGQLGIVPSMGRVGHGVCQFQIRRGSHVEWVENDPILAEGEPGYVIDSRRVKLGDGFTRWTGLPYMCVADMTVEEQSP